MGAQNFYSEEISKVILNKWSQGRCVLLGDTAYYPSPSMGQGTNLAILGAYVLASKRAKDPEHPTKAFEEYEKDMRPYVDRMQSIPLGGYLPVLLNPDTWWDIWIYGGVLSWISWLQPWKYFPGVKECALRFAGFLGFKGLPIFCVAGMGLFRTLPAVLNDIVPGQSGEMRWHLTKGALRDPLEILNDRSSRPSPNIFKLTHSSSEYDLGALMIS